SDLCTSPCAGPAVRRPGAGGGEIMTRSDLPAGQQLDLLDAVAAEPPQLTLDQLLHQLQQWVEVGCLRALDRALVVFLLDIQPDTHPLVLLAAALTSHQLGHGHVCLDLAARSE